MRLFLIALQFVLIAAVVVIDACASGAFYDFGDFSPEGRQTVSAFVSGALQSVVQWFGLHHAGSIILFWAAVTLGAAVLSGYAPTRRVRWLGAGVNAAFALYSLLLVKPAQAGGFAPGALLAPLCALNAALFACLPRAPNQRRNVAAVLVCHAALALLLPGFLTLAAIEGELPPRDLPLLLVIALAYAVPFLVNLRAARQLARTGAFRVAVMTTIFTATASILLSTLSPPLGAPMLLSAVLMLGLIEMRYLFPEKPPKPGSAHEYLARSLGRAPGRAGE